MEKLPNILSSYRTTSRKGTSLIPFHLICDRKAIVPTEIEMSSARINTYGEDNAKKHLLKLDLMEKSRKDRIVVQLGAYK